MKWSEILLIDKPEGISSFDVIRRLRKHYNEQFGEKAPRMGHAGTLDPAASGLMIIGVGPGTKQLTEHIKLDKEYVAEILIGRSTTTGDREGDVLEETNEVAVTEEMVTNTLQKMTGTLTLPVSAYSAIKKDGIPMYKRAREAAKLGEFVKEVPIREMVVYEAELLEYGNEEQPVAKVRFLVGSGTYIRSLAEELGRQLGYPASLQSLRRTKIASHSVDEAHAI